MCGKRRGNSKVDGGMKGSFGRVLRRRSRSSVSAAVLGASLVLEVVITVLTNAHRWRDLQPFDLRLEATAPAKQDKAGEWGKNGGREILVVKGEIRREAKEKEDEY